jgi:ABC-type polysaccharide/polyol phosphate export permease
MRNQKMFKIIKSALEDIKATAKLRALWVAFAREDIGDQHKRTLLGPLWLLINYLAFAATFIFVFERGWTSNYAAHVAIGLLVWFYIMEVITQSVTLFVREQSFIKGTTLPISMYVMRLSMQSVMRAGYALVGCLAILFLSGTGLSIAWLWSSAALLLTTLVTPAVVTVFAFAGAYFPDSQFLVSNLMRIGMFLTPVFWSYDGSGGIRHALYYWNPFTYFLEIVRVPILTGSVPVYSFFLCILMGLFFWTLASILLGKFRKKVVFVL